jgi:hypothetical protein
MDSIWYIVCKFVNKTGLTGGSCSPNLHAIWQKPEDFWALHSLSVFARPHNKQSKSWAAVNKVWAWWGKKNSGQTKFSYWLPFIIVLPPHMCKSVLVWNGVCFVTLIHAWLAYTSEDQVSKLGIKGYSTTQTAWVWWYWKVTLECGQAGQGVKVVHTLQVIYSEYHLHCIWSMFCKEFGSMEGGLVMMSVETRRVHQFFWL